MSICFLYIRSMKRALHIVFKALIKFGLLVAVFAVLPIYCARVFDLDVLPLLITWDFIMLAIFVGASDNKGPGVKTSKPKPIFPWWGF